MAKDPFPSLAKTPLPHPGPNKADAGGKKTLSFYPDRGVYWENDKGIEEFASAGDARITKKPTEGVLQGMLFKPETLREHWDSPERKKAVQALDFSEEAGGGKDERNAVRESRMPTSLINEVAQSGIKFRSKGMQYGYGIYSYKTQTANILPQYMLGDKYNPTVIHELGHGIHDFSARAKNDSNAVLGGNKVQVSNFADPLAEGHAEGISRRYTTRVPQQQPNKDGFYEVEYDDPDHQWFGAGGHDLYSHVRDSVSSTGTIHVINPKLLEPITKWNVFDTETFEHLPESEQGSEHKDTELATRYPKILDMIKSGKTDVPKTDTEPKFYQPTLWDD